MSDIFTRPQIRAKRWKGQAATVAQLKEDGWRCSLFRQRHEIGKAPVYAFGRDRSKKGEYRMDLNFLARFPRLLTDPAVEAFASNFPPHSMLDVEITTGDGARSDVVTALKDPSIPIKISAFAVPWYNGEDCGHATLNWARDICVGAGINFIPFKPISELLKDHGHVTPAMMKENYEEYTATMMKQAGACGCEGWVLKAGGQAKTWYKVKGTQTIDCFITGVVPGEGKYSGMVGAIKCGVYKAGGIVEVCSCSGMTDDERDRMTTMWRNLQLYNRAVEVKYQMVGAGGRLVHPRFVKFREDRSPTDCSIQQIEDEDQ